MFKFLVSLISIIGCNSYNSQLHNIKNGLVVSNLKMNSICPTYIEKYSKYLNQEQGEMVVKKISSSLPNLDMVGGVVLHTTDELINKIINSFYLSLELKKSLVLFLINIAQIGDSAGHQILIYFYDIVNCLL
tara:strand:- start:5109 stop:5504 length:396 start_codon:yes stop_codon:yes gene_type:complete